MSTPTSGDLLAQVVEDVKEVYGTVYAQLTDPAHGGGQMAPEDRIAEAANEVQWAFRRLEARMLFAEAGLDDSVDEGA